MATQDMANYGGWQVTKLCYSYHIWSRNLRYARLVVAFVLMTCGRRLKVLMATQPTS